MTTIYTIITIVVLLIIWGVSIYNSMIRLTNQVQEAWSDIDVQLKRRYDLIPNLIATVKAYQQHESKTFNKVAELRAQAMTAKSVADRAQAESSLSLGLGRLFAIAENYPELKASTNFMDLQKNLSDIEDNIQNARRYYNGTTRDYNTKIQSFPHSIVAKALHFTARDFFELNSAQEKEVPKAAF